MKQSIPRGNAYLRAFVHGKDVIAAAVRGRRATPWRTTVVPASRWWLALTATALLLVGCRAGGATPTDTHARGTQVQEACCEYLQGAERDRCLAEVVRVPDPAAAQTATNQQTYACVVEHFVCDPSTGRETAESAQAQHDCIEDL